MRSEVSLPRLECHSELVSESHFEPRDSLSI
jgi:hypothetical protein